MKRIIMLSILCVLVVFSLTGCNTSVSYTYNVNNENKITITFNTSGGYRMTHSENMKFFDDEDNEIAQGCFLTDSGYEYYEEAIQNDKTVKVIDKGDNDKMKYIHYTVDGKSGIEYNYIIKIKNSNSSYALGSIISLEDVEEIFDRISFNVE